MRPVTPLIAAWLATACIPLDERGTGDDDDAGDGGSWDLGLDTGAPEGGDGVDGDGGDAGDSGVGGDGDGGATDGGGADGGSTDGGADDGGADGGDSDGGGPDGGDSDGGGSGDDGAGSDGGGTDGGGTDGGASDGGASDGGSTDGGASDGGSSDGGSSDGGSTDGGSSDGGSTDPLLTDDDGDGVSEVDGDCDDTDPSVHPDAIETCDGIDQDCDGHADEDFLDDHEDNDSLATATDLGELDGDHELDGLTLTDADDQDWFTFSADDSLYDNVDIEISADLPESGSYLLELYLLDGSDATLKDSDAGSGTLTVDYVGDLLDDDEDDWAVRITSTSWDEAVCVAGYGVGLER